MNKRLTRSIKAMTVALAATSFLTLSSKAETSTTALSTIAAKALVDLNAEGRPDADKARDAGRKPAEVLDFLGIGEGMTVMDVMASGGWYTEVLSIAVGPEGTVYAENPPSFLAWNEGFYDKALTKRLEGGRLANVVRLGKGWNETGLEDGSLDAAMSALNYHDIANGNPEAGASLMAGIFKLLKPGGVFGVIDHSGDEGADNTKLHRIEKALVIAAAEQAGFVLEADSDLLMTGEDDHTMLVFDPAVRGKTDRFLLLLRKPE